MVGSFKLWSGNYQKEIFSAMCYFHFCFCYYFLGTCTYQSLVAILEGAANDGSLSVHKWIDLIGEGSGGCRFYQQVQILEMCSSETAEVPWDNSRVPVPASWRLVQTPSENNKGEKKRNHTEVIKNTCPQMSCCMSPTPSFKPCN